MGKYEPLRLKLEGAQESTVALRFSDIDTAVGGLPNSAHEYRAWWSNSSSNHVAAQSWLAAGFHVSSLDVNGQQVTFTRGPTPNRGTSQHHRGQRAESDVGLLEPVALAAVEIESLQEFLAFRGESAALKDRISAVEAAVAGHDSRRAVEDARQLGLEPTVLAGARLAKRLSAQVDVVVHAAGIVLALPEVLEPGEIIEYVSLGAGNTGKDFDLETDQQIAEFKFIDWAGGTEPVRQDTLLIDIFNLASAATEKRRAMYVLGSDIPHHWLETSRRQTRACLRRRPGVAERFIDVYDENEFLYVRDYWREVRDLVEIVDLSGIVAGLD